MKCEDIERSQIIERYLSGMLSDSAETEFEQHYLGCRKCFEELELRHAAALALHTGDPEGVGGSLVSKFTFWSSPAFRWALAAAALIILLIIPLSLYDREQVLVEEQQMAQGNEDLLRHLGDVEQVPPYLGTTIRGDSSSNSGQKFRDAMDSYERSDFESTAEQLRQVLALEPEHRGAAFYLGISCLVTGRLEEAAGRLNEVFALESSAYEPEARWYLAKAYFRLGRLEEAETQLATLAEGSSEFREEARLNLGLLEEYRRGLQK